jgi:peroxiredoxin
VVGNCAPKFQLEGVFEEDFSDFGLEDYRGKYVVLMFYVRDL